MSFLFLDSILLPSTAGGCNGREGTEDHAVSHHANQGSIVKTAGVDPDSFAENPDSSCLSPKPLNLSTLMSF